MASSDRFDRITERIEAIMQREETLEIFLDASPWGILVVDQTFHIAFINKTLERMSGYRSSELIGRHLHDLMPEADRSKHIEHEKKYIKKPHARQGNHGLKPRILRHDGTTLDVEISLSPTTIHGQKYFFASIRTLDSLFNTVDGTEKQA